MLAIGTKAPEIAAPSSMGPYTLSKQAGRLCTVVYFFPKAFTPLCTQETASFRDNIHELELVGAAVVGVSTDGADTQCKFAASLNVSFPIVADPDGLIGRAYGVRRMLLGFARRVTYVLDPERVVLAVFHHELSAEKHRDDVLLFVDALYRKRMGTKPLDT